MQVQVQTNPYIEQMITEQNCQSNLNTRRHRFSVHGLYMERKPIQEEFYKSAQLYCKQNYIPYELREFYNGFPEDCEYVERLPAFHIYYDDEWMMTFYDGRELEPRLQEIIEGVKAEKKRRWYHFTFSGLLAPLRLMTIAPLHFPRTSRLLTSTPTTR